MIGEFAAAGWAVPGKQTVPRAETFACIGAWHQFGNGSIGSDSAYVVGPATRIRANGEDGVLTGSNRDLWEAMRRHLHEQDSRIFKVRAHTTIQQVVSGEICWHDYAGNGLADMFARITEEYTRQPFPVQHFAKRHSVFAFHTLLRITAIEAHLQQEAQYSEYSWKLTNKLEESSVLQQAQKLESSILAQGHRVHRTASGTVRCAMCQATRSRASFHEFANFECKEKRDISNHVVVQAGNQWQCVICELRATDLEAFGGQCGFSDEEVEEESFVGTQSQFQVQQAKRVQDNIAIRRFNLANERAARDATLARTPAQQYVAHALAGDPPSWIKNFHGSHALMYGAGIVFCRRCGAMTSSEFSTTSLHINCAHMKRRRKHGSAASYLGIPQGSKYRLQQMRSGRHPSKKERWWPDGRPTKVVIQMAHWHGQQVQLPEEPQDSLHSSSDDSDFQFGFTKFPAASTLTPISKGHAAMVGKAIELALERVKAEEDPDVLDVSSVDSVALHPWIIAQGIVLFFESQSWDDYVDDLVDKIHPLESWLNDFISQHFANPPRRRRLRTKTKSDVTYGFPASDNSSLQFWESRGFAGNV